LVFSWLEWLFANPILPDITSAHFNFGESPAISRNVADFAFVPNGGFAVPDIIDMQLGHPPYRQLFHTPVIRVLDVNNGKTLYMYKLDVSVPDPGAITSVELSTGFCKCVPN